MTLSLPLPAQAPPAFVQFTEWSPAAAISLPAASDFRQPLLDQVYELAMDCCQDNWDGECARRISPEAVQAARRFIHALPGAYPPPQVLADPDGWLAFEWYAAPGRSLFVSVDPDYQVHYAAESGASRQHGRCPFFGEFPQEIAQELSRLYPRNLCLV
jgi:hypothetical protein